LRPEYGSDTLSGYFSEEIFFMTQDTKTRLKLARRETIGKKVRALRRQGIIPANIYGHNVESVPVQVSSDELRLLMKQHGRNEIIYVTVEGDERPTFVRDIQRNPVSDQILHVDFMQISLTEKVRLEVPVRFSGVSPAVSTFGGIVTHALTSVLVEALPTSIPSSIEIDISALTEIGQSVHVGDLPEMSGVEFMTDEGAVIVRIDLPAAERAEEAEAAPAEGEEGAAPAEGAEGATPAEGGEGGDDKKE
jgi:large subunit ribosomal protein L25